MSRITASFGKKTTAQQAVEALTDYIRGRNVIITGPTIKGIGFEAARAIATQKPALLVLAGRNIEKLKEAEAEIKKETPDANIRNLVLDLASLKQVRKAANEVLSYPEPCIDVLINNAAIMALPTLTFTEDGHEAQFGTNHLGPFLFTNLIMPKILASKSPRIVNVSSTGHAASDIRYDDPAYKKEGSYDRWTGYGQGKTGNMLFSVALAQRYGSQGLTAFSLHPGGIATPLQKHFTKEDIAGYREKYNAYNEDGTPNMASGVFKTLGEGASTHVVAAFDPSIADRSGSYLNDCQVANEEAKPYALDKDNAEKLWKFSEELVGQTF